MQKTVNEKEIKRRRRKAHIRKSVVGTEDRPRLVVFRSLKHIYAQLVNDNTHHTILTTSTLDKGISDELKKASGKVAKAKIVGKRMSELAKEKNITQVVFDRSGYIYHGRIKAVADGAREGGLDF